MTKPPRCWVGAGTRATIVLGRAQHGLQVRPLLPVRRRASGGGAMLDGPWLLRALVRLPREHALAQHGPAPLARWLGELHRQWLLTRGIAARMHSGASPDHWACFAGRGPGELLVDDRKLVGIAQTWRRSSVSIGAATLLHPAPWLLLCDAFGQPETAARLAAATISLRECADAFVDTQDCQWSLREVLLDGLANAMLLAPHQLARAGSS